MAHLVSSFSIYDNLRRTASKGLISLLNQQQLEELAFKHFSCVNKETGQIGYQCPYTGIEFYNYEDIILEHIIPVSSMGGTVLFNCIPAYKGINGSDEKGAKHLLDWWKNKGKQYYIPERLDKLLSYMFDAYDIVFANHTIEEIENSYEDIDLDEGPVKRYYNNEEKNDDYELSKEDEELKKQAKKAGVISYLGFINDCLSQLKENNYDTTKYEEKLIEYEKYGYFENIERYTLFQNTLKDIVENMLGDKKTGLLSYTINFNISKLIDSMKDCDSKEDIKNELQKRLNNIERILQENNLSTIEYFKSLKDIQDIDILYKNIDEIAPNELQEFLENIKIGIDTKIDIFINMLNKGNVEILKRDNNLTLDGYPSIKLGYFWNTYQDRIKPLLFEILKDDLSYNVARKTVLTYYGVESYEELIAKQNLTTDEMIKIYIDMLNQGNMEVLKRDNNLTLDGYPSVKIAYFWNNHQDKIKQLLFEILKNDETYNVARKTVLTSYGVESYEELIIKQNLTTDEMINIYIDMLNQGNMEILKSGNKLTLDGYPSVKIAYFWSRYQDRIKPLLFEILKDDSSYDDARKTVLTFYGIECYEELIAKQNLTTDKMINIYINMLNKGNGEILKQGNKLTLDGYQSIKLGRFWNKYQDRINDLLFQILKDDSTYNAARKTVLTFYGVESYKELEFKHNKNLYLRRACFIKMLNSGNKEILKKTNKEYFDGYPSVPVGQFWYNKKNREIIIQALFSKLKDNTSYDTARRLILENLKVKNIDEYYEKIEIESKKIKDNKKMKKQLEETIRLVDDIYQLLVIEEHRKRA